jgi:hypothetical protein
LHLAIILSSVHCGDGRVSFNSWRRCGRWTSGCGSTVSCLSIVRDLCYPCSNDTLHMNALCYADMILTMVMLLWLLVCSLVELPHWH